MNKPARTREQAAAFATSQFACPTNYSVSNKKKVAHHYGKCEVHDLLDFIYGGPPTEPSEFMGQPLTLRNIPGRRVK